MAKPLLVFGVGMDLCSVPFTFNAAGVRPRESGLAALVAVCPAAAAFLVAPAAVRTRRRTPEPSLDTTHAIEQSPPPQFAEQS